VHGHSRADLIRPRNQTDLPRETQRSISTWAQNARMASAPGDSRVPAGAEDSPDILKSIVQICLCSCYSNCEIIPDHSLSVRLSARMTIGSKSIPWTMQEFRSFIDSRSTISRRKGTMNCWAGPPNHVCALCYPELHQTPESRRRQMWSHITRRTCN
jgi:hypothetical protein